MDPILWMNRALELARNQSAYTAPNPAVAALIVKDGQLLGQGFHIGAGHAHAEVAALNDARSRGHQLRGATMYVTLEPCCHSSPGKRTPPCVPQIISAGISVVYAACPDPNPEVSGKGMAALKAAGLVAYWGPCFTAGQELIADFCAWQLAKRPLVTLKWAQSLDGRAHDRDHVSQWISSSSSRVQAHLLRAAHDAVAVGAGTLRNDDPSLTIRLSDKDLEQVPRLLESPKRLRLVFAGQEPLPVHAKLFTDAHVQQTWIVAKPGSRASLQAASLCPGRTIDWDGQDWSQLGLKLMSIGVYHLMVEGGPKLLASCIAAGFWDKIISFVAPLLIGGGDSVPANFGSGLLGDRVRLERPEWSIYEGDACLRAWNPDAPALRLGMFLPSVMEGEQCLLV